MIESAIFRKAVNAGGKILENGCVYTSRYSKHNPNRLIQRTIAPNGSYAIRVSENGSVIKDVSKTFLKNNSATVDSWNFSTGSGVYLSTVETLPGEVQMSRVFDKTGVHSISPEGVIYVLRKGDSGKYQTAVKTLDGVTSVAKPFSPMGWLNNEFYKFFNR